MPELSRCEAEASKALDEAAIELSKWMGNEDLESLGIEWIEDEWPEICDELEPAFEKVEDKISELRGDLEILEGFKNALDKVAEAASGTGSILIDMMRKAKYGYDD